MSEWKFYFETYGCKVNQYESQSFREAWEMLGGIESSHPEEADYILINSCAITSRAERDARNAVYRLRRQAPKAKIILAGCGAQFFETFKPIKEAYYSKPDLCLAHSAKDALLLGPMYVLETGEQLTKASGQVMPEHFNRARGIVKVQDGCKQNCTYCIVPKIRSNLYSESPRKILEQCRLLAKNGHGELVISGINLRQYGKDRPEYGDFWDLIACLDKELARDYQDKLRLRISSIEPALLGEKALQTLGTSRLICPHLHLSLQHASGKVLREMGRGHYKAEHILEFTEQLAHYWPIFAFGADLLVGFPGEDDHDLDKLLAFIEASPLSYAHVFPYSVRPATVAGARADQIPQKLRYERAKLVRNVVQAKKRVFLEKVSKLEKMMIALERRPDSRTGMSKGINEYYIQCYIQENTFRSELLQVRPMKVIDGGLLVEGLS